MNLNNQYITRDSPGNPQLSVVIPAYNEHRGIRALYNELIKVLDILEIQWEIIIVDDGSKDDTWVEIKSIHSQDKRVRGLRFTRNFGHQYALFAGLSSAKGSAVITMDADLQHPPEVIPLLLDKWKQGYKIVHTIRKDNENISFTKKLSSRLFYKLFSALSGVDLSEGMADFRLLDRQVVDEIVRSREVSLFLRGLVEWLGFKSTKVEFVCGNRFSGSSKYTITKMIKLAWTGITSFSIIPLRLAIIMGLISGSFALYQLVDTLYIKLFTDRAVEGWASTIGMMSLLFCFLFIFLGIVGEYIGRILVQVRGRDRFIVSEKLDSMKAQENK